MINGLKLIQSNTDTILSTVEDYESEIESLTKQLKEERTVNEGLERRIQELEDEIKLLQSDLERLS